MSPVSYQTIKLSKGKHTDPQDGACVMELASMLAGEPFTDHPASVCPVIGSFLRSYNDSITDRTHASVLALIDKLLEVSTRDQRVSARVLAAARTHALDPAT
jgi:hypothetical protein